MKKVKIFLFIIFASLFLTNISLISNSIIDLDIKSFFDGNTITSLDTPTGLTWKDGSTATAKWNSVTNANYYYLEVFVYNTSDELLGSQETGTADTELDVQQEIFAIIGDSKEELRVKYNVKAAYLSTTEDEVFSNTSVFSNVHVIPERVGTIQLGTPTNVTFNDDYTASWTDVPEADNYYLMFDINGISNLLLGTSVFRDYSSNYSYGTVQNGVFTADLTKALDSIYATYMTRDSYQPGSITIKFKVMAVAGINTNNYADGDYSVYSNSIQYSNSIVTKLGTPTNVTFNDDYTASWTDVPEADNYYLMFDINGNPNLFLDATVFKQYSSKNSYGTVQNGVFTADLTKALDSVYATYMTRDSYQSGTITIKFKVMAVAEINSTNYADGDFSVYSNSIQYTNSTIFKLGTPTNVTFNDDYTASWTDVPGANNYYLMFDVNGNPNLLLDATVFKQYSSKYSYGTVQNGVFTANIKKAIDNMYATYMKRAAYQPGTITIKFKVMAVAERNSNYSNGDFSVYSNAILYNSEGNPNISSITLSPNSPVIGVGRSIYMGKTINPENAYYTTINWSSADSNIVSIDDMGKITGISKGNADITATINNASQSANVRVYEIESNISNENDSNTVIDSASDAIENIVNKSDSKGTDISNIDNVVSEINNAINNGNEFKVDLNIEQKDEDYYDDSFDRIKSMVGNDYKILGGYDVKVELFYEQDSYHKHITNLTELNNKINFDFEFIDDNVVEGKTREYRVVRLHGNSIQELDFNLSNNNMSVSSDKFSDFIVVYRDVEVGTVPFDIDFENNEITLEKWEEDDPFGDASILSLLGATITSMNPDVVQVNDTSIKAVGLGDAVVVVSFDNGNYAVPITIHVVKRVVPIKGDIADSGEVDVDDVILSLRKAFGYEEFNDDDVLASDIDGDGIIGIDDVIYILRYAFGYIDSLEIIN